MANEDIEGIEGTVLTAVQAVGSASSVLASVDDVTATAIAISLADLLESKFPGCCSAASGLEVCPKFKEAFEAGQETPQVFACVKVNELFSKPLRLLPPSWNKVSNCLKTNFGKVNRNRDREGSDGVLNTVINAEIFEM